MTSRSKRVLPPVTSARGAGAVDAPSRRRVGRPVGKSDRRALLIDAALLLFARQGISNTTLRMIADRVGLTPAMAHYYFRTRAQLIDALLEERLFPVCRSIDEVVGADEDEPAALIGLIVQRLLDAAAERPWLAPLWVREMLGDGGTLTQRVHGWLGATGSERWARRVETWQRQGRINRAIEPALVFTSIMALTLCPLASGWTASDAASREKLVRHVGALLGSGLV